MVRWLHRVDEVLSPFRPESDLCRWQRHELVLAQADPMLAEVLGIAREAEVRTGRAFTLAWSPAGPDPTGLVKGWAVDRAAQLATGHGVVDLQVNAGGDVRALGDRPGGGPWRVGIEDPADPSRTVAVLTGRDLCVATSGTSQRGSHVRPLDASVAPVASVTVAGPSLAWADAYSTAGLALGVDAPTLLEGLDPAWTSFVVHTDGSLWRSAGWRD